MTFSSIAYLNNLRSSLVNSLKDIAKSISPEGFDLNVGIHLVLNEIEDGYTRIKISMRLRLKEIFFQKYSVGWVEYLEVEDKWIACIYTPDDSLENIENIGEPTNIEDALQNLFRKYIELYPKDIITDHNGICIQPKLRNDNSHDSVIVF